jgi:G6PDH family F420-dependent oxidoreductase
MRYHPAIVAQAAATLGLLSDNRFTLGLGAGERLNEHVVGMGWHGVAERHERFREAIDIIQGLLSGELSNYRGRHLQLENAKLYDLPKSKPPVVIAAGGPLAARIAREKGDGLMATEPRKDLIDAYGGKGPRYCEVAMCCDASEAAAAQTAHKYFRWSLTGWPVQAELPDTRGFAAASRQISPEAVAETISCGPSVEKHLAAIAKYIKAGFDHIVLVQIGPDQDYFLDLFQREIAPALRKSRAKGKNARVLA